MAAAVADYRPGRAARRKAPEGRRELDARARADDDVLARSASEAPDGQVLVGFAADHGEQGLERAREKLKRKSADLIVYNDVSRPTSASTPPRTR